MASPQLLAQHTVFITGAGRGLGAAIALGLAELGAQVVASDVDGEAAKRSAADIRAAGYTATALALDVADAQACRAAAAAFTLPAGQRLVLVNNAGVRPNHAFDDAERDAQWRRALDVNLEGARNTTLAFQALLAASGGNVVNISSLAAARAAAHCIAYSTSKAALEMLTKVLALELAPQGIRVNAVAPGVMRTAMTEQTRKDPAHVARMLGRIPLKRYGEPEEMTGPVAFLASPLASYVTASVLVADGGYLAT